MAAAICRAAAPLFWTRTLLPHHAGCPGPPLVRARPDGVLRAQNVLAEKGQSLAPGAELVCPEGLSGF